MKTLLCTAAALASAAFALSACGSDPYYTRPVATYSYNDCYGRYRPSYCTYPSTYPTYSGAVVIGGTSYTNLPYRDGPRGREYWLDGRWYVPA